MEDEFTNPFEDPVETTTNTTEDVAESTDEVTEDVEEVVEDTEAEQTAQDESEAEESAEETDVEEEASESEDKTEDDTKPDKDASNEAWARWRREQKEKKQAEAQERLKQHQEYLQNAESDEDLRFRQLEVNQANAQQKIYDDTVERNAREILSEYARIESDPVTQIFNPKSSEFKKGQYERMQSAYEAMHISTNPHKPDDIVEVRESIYKFAKDWAADLQKDFKIAEAKATKTVARNISKSEPASNSVSKPPKQSDPLMDLWDSED